MTKFYNKFFITFLIIAVFVALSFPQTAEAGFFKKLFKTIVKVVAFVVVAAVVVAAVWATGGAILAAVGVVGGTTGAIAAGIGLLILGPALGIGIAQCAVLGQNSWTNPNCGEGTPGSPILNNQTATPIKQNVCTTGFTLSYDVTDAYQYAIYRDGNLITQATLSATVQPSPFNSKFSYNDTNLAPVTNYTYVLNLVSKDGKQFRSPEMNVYTDCPPHIVFNGPNIIEYPNPITLSWIAENVTSLVASGDWSGSKEMGTYPYKSEQIQKPRGTYTFILSGTGPGGSDSKQVTTQVIKIPRCTFTADPTTIILPQTSTLSWSCAYADTCSIDQGVGSVNNISGSQAVRPSATTTYTLTCDGQDGERTWQSTVNVGFTPRLREVAP